MTNTDILGEISPGDPDVWVADSFEQWKDRERFRTALDAWSKQTYQERRLRTQVALFVFSLIGFQVLGLFGLVYLDSFDIIEANPNLLSIAIPSVVVEIIGVSYIVVKYLFSVSLRQNLDAIVKEK